VSQSKANRPAVSKQRFISGPQQCVQRESHAAALAAASACSHMRVTVRYGHAYPTFRDALLRTRRFAPSTLASGCTSGLRHDAEFERRVESGFPAFLFKTDLFLRGLLFGPAY
jgi:hypothetical protein